MSIDPFRVQILSLGLDSQMVLTLIGLIIAGLVFRASARRQGVTVGMDIWWDVLLAGIIGARFVWVAQNAAYYLRSPQEVLAVTDGGLDPIGLLLGASYALWNVRRRMDQTYWVTIVTGIAVSALTVLLFERSGCALTTCGSGPVSDVAWATQRGEQFRQPLALYQVGILAVALVLASELRVRPAAVLGIAVSAAMLSATIGLVVGGETEFEVLLALGLAGFLGALTIRGFRLPFTGGAIIR